MTPINKFMSCLIQKLDLSEASSSLQYIKLDGDMLTVQLCPKRQPDSFPNVFKFQITEIDDKIHLTNMSSSYLKLTHDFILIEDALNDFNGQ